MNPHDEAAQLVRDWLRTASPATQIAVADEEALRSRIAVALTRARNAQHELFRGADGFVLFKRGMFVSINSQGRIGLYGDVYEALGKPARVALALDREKAIVQVRVATETDRYSFRANNQGNAPGCYIKAPAFPEWAGLTLTETHTYRVEMHEGSALVLLHDPHAASHEEAP